MRASMPRALWLGLIFVLALAVSSCTSAAGPGAIFVPAQPATPAATATVSSAAQATTEPTEPPVPEVAETLTPTAIPSPTSEAAAAVTETESLATSPTPGVTPTEHLHPTATAEASSTAEAETTTVETAALAPNILYQDDFTDPGSGWQDNLEFGSYYIGYHEPDYYHVEVHTPYDRALVAVPEQRFDDFTVDSQAFPDPNNTAPTGDFRYGLFFRRSGNRYYAFVVSPRTKTWYVLKSSPTGLTELKKGTEASIHDVPGVDALRVDVKGPTFFFHINDQTVAGVSDADYASGEVGFYVETYDAARVHIHYDAITIREVETPQLLCTVVTAALRLRKGPDTTYAIVTSLSGGIHFEPLARSADGLWIEAHPEGSDQTGWVASSPELVACNTSVDSLPLAR
jgi:hypothetical protein